MTFSSKKPTDCFATLLCLMLFSGSPVVIAQDISDASDVVDFMSRVMNPPVASDEERARLQPILAGIVQNRVATEARLPGQRPIVATKVWYNDKGNVVYVDLGRAYLPAAYTIAFEERLHEIAELIHSYPGEMTPVQVEVLFDGKNVFDYFPEEGGPSDRVLPETSEVKRPKRDVGKGRLLVSAGHGVYYNSRYKEWKAQRDSANGIVEDFVTPVFARHLEEFLLERSGAEIIRARSIERTRHAESNQPWASMAARYHIKESVPDLPSIWNSPGESDPGQEERDQDIRSRPLFANHLGVDAALHVHTNADRSSDTRGIRVYHYEKSTESRRLAELALCYMKESLGSNSSYADFPVSTIVHSKNHGENRLANMPSIIVELGFHTNKDDANAIGNYYFQSLTMRGLEKAYRLFKQGHACEPFTAKYSDVSVTSDSFADATVEFGGFPRFPVNYESTVTECPSGVMCGSLSGRLEEPSAPLKVTHRCSTEKPFSIKWNVRFTDADGIRANTTAAMQCNPKAKIPRKS